MASTKIAESQYTPYKTVAAAVPNGFVEIGCVFTSESEHPFINRILYAYFDGSYWNVEYLSNDLNQPRTFPSIVSRNEKIYAIYGE